MWTIVETMVTTRIITPDSVSSCSAQSTSTPPARIQVASGMICGSSAARMLVNSRMPDAIDSSIAPQVTSCDPRKPICRPKNPAIAAASSGRKTTATATGSASHHVNVFDLDRAAVAEIDDEDRQTDRRLGRRDGQHKHREDLADKVVQRGRKGDEVDVDGEQHQRDRHHDDNDVLAVQKNAEDAEREQDRCDGQVMREADFTHLLFPRLADRFRNAAAERH